VAIPTPRLPKPNAYDDHKAAAALMVKSPLIDRPGTGTVSEREGVLRQNAAALATFRRGLGHDYREPPVRSIATLSPHYSQFRQMARLLATEASVHEDRGEWARALDSRLDCIQFGSDIPHGGGLIGMLVGMAIDAIGRKGADRDADHLTAVEARRAAVRLQSILDRQVSYPDVLQEEKWFEQAALMETFRDPSWRTSDPMGMAAAGGSRWQSATQSGELFVISNRRIMGDTTRTMDDLIARARKPYAAKLPPPPPPGNPLTEMLLPIMPSARFNLERARALDSLLMLQLALRAYRLEHGTQPQRLGELVPAYLPRLPEDPFALKGGFGYRRSGGSRVLYSIGPDGKDDGGKAARGRYSTNPFRVQADSQGDIVAGISR